MTKWEHNSDVKFLVVYVNKATPINENGIEKMYFGAHGTYGGQWIYKNQIEIMDNSHPVAYSCLGDHSFYYSAGLRPRIYGVVYERCAHDILTKPQPHQIFENTDPRYDPSTMGWLYFPASLCDQGVSPPSQQWSWTLALPDESHSNNWWRRLLIPQYF